VSKRTVSILLPHLSREQNTAVVIALLDTLKALVDWYKSRSQYDETNFNNLRSACLLGALNMEMSGLPLADQTAVVEALTKLLSFALE
jgi:hypothetical protein